MPHSSRRSTRVDSGIIDDRFEKVRREARKTIDEDLPDEITDEDRVNLAKAIGICLAVVVAVVAILAVVFFVLSMNDEENMKTNDGCWTLGIKYGEKEQADEWTKQHSAKYCHNLCEETQDCNVFSFDSGF